MGVSACSQEGYGFVARKCVSVFQRAGTDTHVGFLNVEKHTRRSKGDESPAQPGFRDRSIIHSLSVAPVVPRQLAASLAASSAVRGRC